MGTIERVGLVLLLLAGLANFRPSAVHAQGGADYLSGGDTRRLMSPAERAVTLVSTGERYLAKAEQEGKELAAGEGGPKQARRVVKEYERALRSFEQVLGKDGRNQPAMRGQGLALLGLGRAQEALPACTRALELRPQDEGAALCQFRARLGVEAFELAWFQLDTAKLRWDPVGPKLEAQVRVWLVAHRGHARYGEVAGWVGAAQ
jgi:tetratricopeptide (TPR) repeat protein